MQLSCLLQAMARMHVRREREREGGREGGERRCEEREGESGRREEGKRQVMTLYSYLEVFADATM